MRSCVDHILGDVKRREIQSVTIRILDEHPNFRFQQKAKSSLKNIAVEPFMGRVWPYGEVPWTVRPSSTTCGQSSPAWLPEDVRTPNFRRRSGGPEWSSVALDCAIHSCLFLTQFLHTKFVVSQTGLESFLSYCRAFGQQ